MAGGNELRVQQEGDADHHQHPDAHANGQVHEKEQRLSEQVRFL